MKVAYKEEKVERVDRYTLGGKIVEERVRVVRYIRFIDCKCAGDPYQEGCVFCNENIDPYLCGTCGNYYCKCDAIEDVKRPSKSTF